MSNNLILVYPPRINESPVGDVSLALLYLAGAARNSGLCDNICIFDFNTPSVRKSVNDLIDVISKLPDGRTVVAINCLYSALFPTVKEITQKLKKIFPCIKITIGGMHPTIYAEEIIANCPEIDSIAIGEADLEFPKLLQHYFEGKLVDLDGYYLRLNDAILFYPKTSYIHNLDDLPLPGYEFYNFNEYLTDVSNYWNPDNIEINPLVLPLLTSRSCPNMCNFCSMWLVMGNKFRQRSAENVFNEIKYLHEQYGVNYFRISDDNLTFDRNRTLRLCDMIIDSGMKLYFDTYNGISLKTLDKEVVGAMRKAGFILVSLAVESGSDYLRNNIMGKRISRKQIVDAFKMCVASGMNVCAYFIIGMPEETEETIKDTADLINELDFSRISISVAKPFPGTKLFEQCVRDNLLIGGFNAETLWTGEAEAYNTKKELRYTQTLLTQHSRRQFWIKPYKLSIERLHEIDIELQNLAIEKTKSWIEHVRKVWK